MSIHAKALAFVAWTVCLLLLVPSLLEYVHGRWGGRGLLLVMAVWLGHGVAAMLLFRCPACGTSVFDSGKGGLVLRTPWPRRRCGHCGHDLTR